MALSRAARAATLLTNFAQRENDVVVRRRCEVTGTSAGEIT